MRLRGRQLVNELRATAVRAPAGLTEAVLGRVGLRDEYVELPGPIGPLFVAYGVHGITSVERAGDPGDFEAGYMAQFGQPVRRAASVPAGLAARVAARLKGDRAAPEVDLASLTEFERAVLTKTAEIPYGEIRPYGWVAREIGRPRAVRAVGSALAHNPVPFVIPCHRVVRSDGTIGEYGAGGPTAKRAVLRAEGVDVDGLERLAGRGIRFLGSDTTGIFCYPSCRNARRITEGHRVPLRTVSEAEGRGFRGCKVCRPAVELIAA